MKRKRLGKKWKLANPILRPVGLDGVALITYDISVRDDASVCIGHRVDGTHAVVFDKILLGKKAEKFYKKYLKGERK